MAAYPAYPAAPTRSRPIGVTILAVLTILGGVLLLLLGIVVVAFSSLLVGVGLPLGFGLTGSVLGAIILIFGIIWIAVGSGLLNLRPWAWWLAIIVMVLSIVGSIGSPITAILPGLILLYLILVRRHFR
ncbi:MAG: hypothetical protein E6J94_05270 [Methanobacteriota archaeon]|nr:MAG: hypothetical protein E6J94_05270 [Euryarchaeota archaeon]